MLGRKYSFYWAEHSPTLCYSLMNPVSISGMLMVSCGCGVSLEKVITLTALFRRIECLGVGRDQLSSPNSTPCLPWQNECHLLPG